MSKRRQMTSPMAKLMEEEAKRSVVPTLERAIRDLRFYAERLTVEKPERYEVYQTAGDGTTVKLSDAIRVALANLASPNNLPAPASDGERTP